MYLLDTNVVSELRVRTRAHPKVKAWEARTDRATTFISVMTVMELELGIVLKRRKDPLQAKVFQTWLQQKVLPEFEDRILPVSVGVALRWAGLQVPKTRPLSDALIAATALEHNLIVVTRNVSDFEPTGVSIVNPWE